MICILCCKLKEKLTTVDDYLSEEAISTQKGYQNPTSEDRLTAEKSLLESKITRKDNAEPVPRESGRILPASSRE